MSKDFTTDKRSIKISFTKETHRVEINAISGKEMIIAVESLKEKVAEQAGMPYEMALVMAAKAEEKEKEEQA